MHTNVDFALLEGVSRRIEMASATLSRRHSKGPSNAPRMGGSMRIARANSTSNSPRNSAALNRRRNLVGDGAHRRQQPAYPDQNSQGHAERSQAFLTPLQAVSQTRPVSWHPSAYSTFDTQYQQPIYNPTMSDYSMSFGNTHDLPHTPALQSNYGSPSGTFSPELQPWSNYDHDYLCDTSSVVQPSANDSMADFNNIHAPFQLPMAAQTQQTPNDFMNPSIYSHFDWNNFAATGFGSGTAPPTPENFLPIQHPDPPCVIEPSTVYHALDEPEDDSEVLVGMGLYDAPDKPSLPDLQFDQFRSTMISQYLGSTYKAPEATGKGLKLEETWKPSDGEDGEDDGEQDGDADGSMADEDEQPGWQQVHVPAASHGSHANHSAPLHPSVQLYNNSRY